MAYLIMKIVHILGAVLFLGNIIVSIFWKAHGDRSRDPRIMAHTLEGIIAADRRFTMPGVLLLLVAGFGGAGMGRLPILQTGWIWISIILFVISAAAFMARVVPLQKRMRRLAAEAAASGSSAAFNQPEYDRLSRGWAIWGAIALIAPLIALVLMVLKRPL